MAFLGEGTAARPRQHAVGESLLTGLGEPHERSGAEPEFAASAPDDEPLDPASSAGRLDEEVQAVAVSVPQTALVEGTRHGQGDLERLEDHVHGSNRLAASGYS